MTISIIQIAKYTLKLEMGINIFRQQTFLMHTSGTNVRGVFMGKAFL